MVSHHGMSLRNYYDCSPRASPANAVFVVLITLSASRMTTLFRTHTHTHTHSFSYHRQAEQKLASVQQRNNDTGKQTSPVFSANNEHFPSPPPSHLNGLFLFRYSSNFGEIKFVFFSLFAKWLLVLAADIKSSAPFAFAHHD